MIAGMRNSSARPAWGAGRVLAMAASALVLLAGGVIWQTAFRAPEVEPLPLPGQLIALSAAEGRRLLAESPAVADYQPLMRSFEVQRRRAYCGVASSVTVLNALRPSAARLTQADFFADLASELPVTFEGMTLQQLGELLRGRGVRTHVVFAQDTDLERFREMARANLARAGDYMLVNYQRGALGQREGGHISPLAAYSADTDRFLILDVAAYRYPPTWVATAQLWRAMNTLDAASGRSRGFVIVSSS
jgi:hypothetical protein